jgi:putative ubiquitin-RnfH superfamily antitoxin RatB of RatAB toxin-antitoxin module
MEYRVKRPFSSTICGNKAAGDKLVGVPDKYIDQLKDNDLVEAYETKVIKPKPKIRRKRKRADNSNDATD